MCFVAHSFLTDLQSLEGLKRNENKPLKTESKVLYLHQSFAEYYIRKEGNVVYFVELSNTHLNWGSPFQRCVSIPLKTSTAAY